MTSEQPFSPQSRSRLELAQVVDQAVGYESLNKKEGRVLRELFGVDGRDTTITGKVRNELLRSIGNKIEDRKVELLQRRFVNRQLGYSGLLGLAIGDSSNRVPPMGRPALMIQPVVTAISEKNPRVDPSIILDKTLEFDVRWLSEPTVPRRGVHDPQA